MFKIPYMCLAPTILYFYHSLHLLVTVGPSWADQTRSLFCLSVVPPIWAVSWGGGTSRAIGTLGTGTTNISPNIGTEREKEGYEGKVGVIWDSRNIVIWGQGPPTSAPTLALRGRKRGVREK